MKRKPIVIVLFIIVLVVMGWFAKDLIMNHGKSNDTLNSFAISDTASVDRIIITTSFNEKIDLVRVGDRWETKDGKCLQQQPIETMLHTFKNIAIQSFIPEAAVQNIKNQLSVNYKKVEIFQNGSWSKTWYVGSDTPDHYGTYVLLETPEEGVASAPFILEMKGLKGTIDPRFFADYRQWACSEIFTSKMEDIKQVKVKNYANSEESFTLSQLGKDKFDLLVDGKEAKGFSPVKADEYLHRFANVHFSTANYILNKSQVDSLKKTTPYYSVEVIEKNKKTSLKAFKIKLLSPDVDFNGDTLYYDNAHMWGLMDNGEVVKVQYYVFDPIFVKTSFFKP